MNTSGRQPRMNKWEGQVIALISVLDSPTVIACFDDVAVMRDAVAFEHCRSALDEHLVNIHGGPCLPKPDLGC